VLLAKEVPLAKKMLLAKEVAALIVLVAILMTSNSCGS
jgi:hypothetical protein